MFTFRLPLHRAVSGSTEPIGEREGRKISFTVIVRERGITNSITYSA